MCWMGLGCGVVEWWVGGWGRVGWVGRVGVVGAGWGRWWRGELSRLRYWLDSVFLSIVAYAYL